MPSGYPGSAQKVCPDCGGTKTETRYPRCKVCAYRERKNRGCCQVAECTLDVRVKGMCEKHAENARRAALPLRACSFEACEKDSRYGSRGMCSMHYQRSKRRGVPDDAALSRRPNGVGGTRQELRRSYENARRARKQGNFIEHVDLATLWERDGGTCHICSEPAERWNWHMDHIIPVSKGGEHSYVNTAVSHPGCNLRKGAKIRATS